MLAMLIATQLLHRDEGMFTAGEQGLTLHMLHIGWHSMCYSRAPSGDLQNLTTLAIHILIAQIAWRSAV